MMIIAAISALVLLGLVAVLAVLVRDRARQHTVEMPAGETIFPPLKYEARRHRGDPRWDY